MSATSGATTTCARWLAIADHHSGLGVELLYYPDERQLLLRSLGRRVLGEFASQREAANAVSKFTDRRLNGGIVKLSLHK